MQTNNLDFLYVEKDPRTQQPSACIYVKSSVPVEITAALTGRMISTHCLNFIELDAELRRLHAELDEIRAQAKKKFYKSEVIVGAAAGS